MGDHLSGTANGSKGGKPMIVSQGCDGDYRRGLVVGAKGSKPVVAWGECQNSLAIGEYKVGTVVGSKGGKPVVAVGCRACSCSTTIRVLGCNEDPLPGATVTIGAESGGTGPTGEATLDLPSAGTYTVEVTAPGFAPYSGSLELACDGTTEVQLTPTEDAECGPCCPQAVPHTLIGTNRYGSFTLAYNGGFWFGKQTVALPAALEYCVNIESFGTVTRCDQSFATGTADVTFCWRFEGDLKCGSLQMTTRSVCTNCNLSQPIVVGYFCDTANGGTSILLADSATRHSSCSSGKVIVQLDDFCLPDITDLSTQVGPENCVITTFPAEPAPECEDEEFVGTVSWGCTGAVEEWDTVITRA